MISIVVAIAQNGTIGKNNQLLWHLPADLKHFKTITTGHTVVMGRKTYESIGRPLPNRTNIVISRNLDFKAEGCIVVRSLEEAIREVKGESEKVKEGNLENTLHFTLSPFTLFVIGGAEIYRQALPWVDKIYLTEVKAEIDGDAFFPVLRPDEWHEIARNSHKADEKNQYDYDFVELVRVRP
ncbi:MAG: dihydrofolate reductase [Spirosomataceae bacterium]